MHCIKKETKKQVGGSKALDTEGYILIAKKVGFTVAELEWFDVGGVLDVAIEFINANNEEDIEEPARRATQEDFDLL